MTANYRFQVGLEFLGIVAPAGQGLEMVDVDATVVDQAVVPAIEQDWHHLQVVLVMESEHRLEVRGKPLRIVFEGIPR